MAEKKFRDGINVLVSKELHNGAPALALATALMKHVQHLMAIAVVAQELDRRQIDALFRKQRRKSNG